MASSSKNIQMPLIFAVSIGAAVSLIAIVMFGLAWYEYESRVVLQDHVVESPTHSESYEAREAEQRAHLAGIDAVIEDIANEHAPDAPEGGDMGPGHEGHGHDVH